MLSKRHVDALKKQTKRRASIPHAQPISVRASVALENRIIRDHQQVVQAIEMIFLQALSNAKDIDDHLCDTALQASIRGLRPSDERAAHLFDVLAAEHDSRPNISDDLWRDGMKVVRNSVERHSSCRPGDTDYLDFLLVTLAPLL
jgi:hypothetical protein